MDKSQFLFGRGFGEKIDIPVIIWYLESPESRILVDTGIPEPAWCAKYHYPTQRRPDEEPVQALTRAGVGPQDIDIVILTHLHWDHCYNNSLFQNASFLVQREELKYAIAPLPVHAKGYESMTIGMNPPYWGTKFDLLDGDTNIVDGVRVLSAPGHTPGMQGVLVNTAQGDYFIAGDNIPLYENMEGDKISWCIPGSNFCSLEDYYRSLSRIQTTVGKSFVLPGHDPRVLLREAYP